jgi:hypothetical protein
MKGFPNQVADLEKIASAMGALATVVDSNSNARDDGVLGVALVRAGVAGTGHVPRPVDEYLREQLKKKESNQSFRTTARGLRELFRLLRLIDDSGGRVLLTENGRRAAGFADSPLNPEQIGFWRKTLANFVHTGANGEESHPYQVLLRLVARKPGITRAKCALALEARNDSAEELERIVVLADLDEDVICRQIGVTKSNWDNAKKVLPKFAEQLGDVIRTGQSFVLADSPGRGEATVKAPPRSYTEPHTARRVEARQPASPTSPRAPRASRAVTPESIGRAGIAEQFDEVEIPLDLDPERAREAIKQRLDRLKRHNLIVRALASRFQKAGANLFEDPFDVLALFGATGILGEIKTLSGEAADERDRVQEALAQLLYYEAFVTAPVAGGAAIRKVACFESRISGPHQQWLNAAGIASLWCARDDRFEGDSLAVRLLGDFLQELR